MMDERDSSTNVQSINLYENTLEEHEWLCEVFYSIPPMHQSLMIGNGEKQFDSMHEENPEGDT